MQKSKIEWTDFDRGYISGIVDGEGSISLIKELRPYLPQGCVYKPRLQIGNSNLAILKKVQRLTGGSISTRKKDGLYTLEISANNMRKALPELTLIGKVKQKELICSALDLIAKRHRGQGNPTTREETESFEYIYNRIRGLNGSAWNKNAKNKNRMGKESRWDSGIYF